MVNYIVDPGVLKPYVPKGVELDFWENKCYLSLVGFLFKNTKLRGIKIPRHVNFEEVNLRIYVKREVNGEQRRGVVFIKEIVPRFAVSFVANRLYRENYQTLPMGHSWHKNKNEWHVDYRLKHNKKWQDFGVVASDIPEPIRENTETEFITEHYWGYTKIDNNRSFEYRVKHPKWEKYPVKEYHLNIDFGSIYGKRFQFLNDEEPASVMLAEGSTVSVEERNRI